MPVVAKLDVSEKSNSSALGTSGAGAADGTAVAETDPLPLTTSVAFAEDTPGGGPLGFFLAFGAASSVCFVFHFEMLPRT